MQTEIVSYNKQHCTPLAHQQEPCGGQQADSCKRHVHVVSICRPLAEVRAPGGCRFKQNNKQLRPFNDASTVGLCLLFNSS